MLSRLKFSTLGKAIWPFWKAVRSRTNYRKNHLALREAIGTNLQQFLVGDPVVRVSAFGGEFQISAGSDLFLRLITNGEYESDLAEVVIKHIQRDKDAIDVGANIGFFTCMMAKLLNNRKVLAIEPTDGANNRLRANLERNGVNERVVVFRGVAAMENGSIELSFVENKEEYSSIGTITHPSVENNPRRTTTVPSATLDTLVRENQLEPGFIKIDVEGAEGFVLDGAEQVLREFHPIVLSELSDELLKQKGYRAAQIVAKLESLGYRVIDPLHPELPAGTRPFGDILAIPQ